MDRLLKAVPEDAFGSDRSVQRDAALRALHGAERGFESARADLAKTLAWRREHHVDEVRHGVAEESFACRKVAPWPRIRVHRAPRRTVGTLGRPSASWWRARPGPVLTRRPRAQLLTRDAPGCAAFREAWPSTLCGPDDAGNVVWLDKLADIDIYKLAALPHAALVAGRAQQLEAVQARKRRSPVGVRQSQHFYILDCAGGSLPLTPATWRVLHETAGIGADHYADSLRRCFVINAHPAARMAWAALRVIIHPATIARVRIVADVAELRRLAAADGLDVRRALPASLGGACADATPLARDITEMIRAANTVKACAPPTLLGPPATPAAPPAAAPLPKSPRKSKHMKRQRSNTSVGGSNRKLAAPCEPPRKG